MRGWSKQGQARGKRVTVGKQQAQEVLSFGSFTPFLHWKLPLWKFFLLKDPSEVVLIQILPAVYISENETNVIVTFFLRKILEVQVEILLAQKLELTGSM